MPVPLMLSHEFHGQGKDLILISGHQTTRLSWRDFWKPLTSSFRLTLLDNRGMGLSPVSESSYSVSDMAQDVIHLMDYNNIKKASFLGHSMGGAVVQEIGKQFPHRVDKAIIASSFTKFPMHAVYQVKAFAKLAGTGISREQMVALSLPWLYGEAFLNSPQAVAKEIEIRMNNPYPPNLNSLDLQTKALFDFNSRAWLNKIKIPTLIIGGSEDLYVPFRYSKELAMGIPGSKLVEIAQAGHGLQVEKPEEFIAEIVDFLK